MLYYVPVWMKKKRRKDQSKYTVFQWYGNILDAATPPGELSTWTFVNMFKLKMREPASADSVDPEVEQLFLQVIAALALGTPMPESHYFTMAVKLHTKGPPASDKLGNQTKPYD